ncbi:MAG: site-specific integrase [Pseudomonadota bacterium]
MYGPAKALDSIAELKVLEHIRTKHWRTAKRDTVAVLLSWRAGLRVSEIAQICWSDVATCTGELCDQVRVRRETTKGKTFTRFVPMHPELSSALQALRTNACTMEQTILLNRQRGAFTVNALTVWFHRLYRAANLDGASSHSGRRGFITRCARSCTTVGASIEDVRDMAGHALLSTTAAYIDANAEAKRKLVDGL